KDVLPHQSNFEHKSPLCRPSSERRALAPPFPESFQHGARRNRFGTSAQSLAGGCGPPGKSRAWRHSVLTAFSGQSQAHHLLVHGGRAFATGDFRLQTAAQPKEWRRPPAISQDGPTINRHVRSEERRV